MKSPVWGSWWWRLLSRARRYTGSLATLIVLSFIGIGFDLAKPWPLKIIVDSVLPAKPLPQTMAWVARLPRAESRLGLLAWLSAATLIVFLIAWLNRAVEAYLRVGTGNRMSYRLAADVFDHLQGLSLGFHNRWPTGDLVKRVAVDCACMRGLIIDVCLPAITALTSLIVIFLMIRRFDSTLAYLALLVVPAIAIIVKGFSGSMEVRNYRESKLQGELMARAEQALTALPIIQAFEREKEESRKLSELTDNVGRAYLQTIATGLQFKIATGAVLALGTALLIAIGGRHVLQGRILLGDLLVFLNYLALLYAPVETLAYLSMSFAWASAGARRVFEVMESDDRVRESPGARLLTRQHQSVSVRLENVSFSYKGGAAALHGVTLEGLPGQTIALVGPTGAGKTTLVSLILRLHDPDSGRVTVDGEDIRELQLASLRSSVSIVLQDPFMLPMTIGENIAYGRPDASKAEIVAAAESANADEFIRELPNGYDTAVGERGATLSGGQRQRIAIARAFLKDAPVLILDEPTSALDAKTEALLSDAMKRLMAGRTTFIIGHRLSTVRHADRIIVLQNGRISESGTHDELIAAQGLYDRLCKIQFTEPVMSGLTAR